MHSDPQELKLIRDCLLGKRSAQRRLYERHKVYLFGVALRYAKSRPEAEDVLQEGFYKIFKDLKQFDAKGPLRAWMRKVIVNTALMHIRRHHRISYTSLESREVENYLSPDVSLMQRDRANAIIRLIQELPVAQQMVFNLRAIEGYSFKDISQKLGANEATLRSHYLRARTQLQAMLSKELNNDG